MSAQIVVEFRDGSSVHFQPAQWRGLSDVGAVDGIVRVSAEKFKAALSALPHLISALEESLGSIAHRPDKIELEFGAALSSDVDLWVVSGKGKADFKVKLSWDGGPVQEKKEAPAAGVQPRPSEPRS